ncbi:MAG: hypothetical protein CML23_05250 [Rhizobiaceae bacterium]|nr:hypothetical protein [Rhizobiaceae bacterium]
MAQSFFMMHDIIKAAVRGGHLCGRTRRTVPNDAAPPPSWRTWRTSMIDKIKHALESSLLYLASAMLAIMAGLMLWQVFTRYVLASPALYTEELLRFMMIWMAFLGSAYAFGTRQHLSLVFVIEALSGRKKLILMLINDTVVLVFSAFILFLGGIKAVTSSMTQYSPIMRIPIGEVYLIMPIAAVLIFILQSLNMIILVRDSNRAALKPVGSL